MDKSINIVINETKSNVIKVLNESNLPISVLELIISELHNIVTNQLAGEIQKELIEINKEKLKNETTQEVEVGQTENEEQKPA